MGVGTLFKAENRSCYAEGVRNRIFQSTTGGYPLYFLNLTLVEFMVGGLVMVILMLMTLHLIVIPLIWLCLWAYVYRVRSRHITLSRYMMRVGIGQMMAYRLYKLNRLNPRRNGQVSRYDFQK